MDKRYDILADYLSDHLWQRNQLDYDFLANFPEFSYKGKGYRVLFLETKEAPNSFKNQSFCKTKSAVNEILANAQKFDQNFLVNKKAYIYECEIEGFDVHLALIHFKKTRGLTQNTIESFIGEEEVIALSCSEPFLISDN
jgi:hypothetical protein